MHLRALLPLLSGLAVLHFAASAAAVPFGFECITYNDAADCSIGEAQVVLDVGAGPGADQVSFTFQNIGSEMSTIARIYFDDGSLTQLASIINGPGVSFVYEPAPAPDDLPGGNLASPPFVTSIGFLSGAAAPPPGNGIENDLLGTEYLTLVFDLETGQTLADVINELNNGTLRTGLHVINFDSGGSESLVSVPEPGTAALLMLGLTGLFAARRLRA